MRIFRRTLTRETSLKRSKIAMEALGAKQMGEATLPGEARLVEAVIIMDMTKMREGNNFMVKYKAMEVVKTIVILVF